MNAVYVPGNRVNLLETGAEYFPALLAEIEQACREIYLETYMFADDDTGLRVSQALIRAAQRGVAVHVMVDGFGAREFPNRLGQKMSAAQVNVLVYRPDLAPHRFRRHKLRRLHRKLSVIDGRVAFVGGINVIDDHEAQGDSSPRFDYAVRIEGPLVPTVRQAMLHLWRLVSWVRLRRRTASRVFAVARETMGDVDAALVIRDNLRHRRDIENAYLAAITSARNEVIIANAYFLPGWRFRHALMDAAARGVRVVLLLQGRIEYVVLHFATQALYGSLINAGVQIYEYHRSFLHAKVAVVDGHWATVGSSNIDPFSLLLAREANVLVQHAGFAEQLRSSLIESLASGGKEVKKADLARTPWWQRFLRWSAYGVMRLAVGLAGYGAGRDYGR